MYANVYLVRFNYKLFLEIASVEKIEFLGSENPIKMELKAEKTSTAVATAEWKKSTVEQKD